MEMLGRLLRVARFLARAVVLSVVVSAVATAIARRVGLAPAVGAVVF
jgi:hypothetical protein